VREMRGADPEFGDSCGRWELGMSFHFGCTG